MLEVLLYLFQNYLHPEERAEQVLPLQDELIAELAEAGFIADDVAQAFSWLAGISQLRRESDPMLKQQPQTTRCYTHEEIKKLSLESRGFILSLEQAGILNQVTRELVIDRAMALEVEGIDVDGLKWVVLMVLLNQSNYSEAAECLESALLDSRERVLH